MSVDVLDLRSFYTQPVGMMARRLVGRGIRARWPLQPGLRIVGIGYAPPYLGLFREVGERVCALMPAQQGVIKWPTAAPTLSALVDEGDLPLADAVADRVLMVHALENVIDPEAMLGEAWRILAAGGRLLIVVPNRRGVWARTDATPFGQGRPYSRPQLTALLKATQFTPLGWSEALYLPPIRHRWMLKSAQAWERIGASLSLPFAGVHIVEASKQVYRLVPAERARRLAPRLGPIFAPPRPASPRIGQESVLRRPV